MLDSVVFPCARDGLAATLRSGLLGGYDGAGSWSLALRNLRDGDEQLMVETHEGLHHELQASTGYGLVSAMALLLSKRGFRPLALPELFDAMVEGSRETHEVFATTLSASLAGVRQARSMLDGNTVYLGHLARGLGLAGADEVPWRFRETASAAVLRCAMAPLHVFDVLETGFARMRRSDLAEAARPDRRLAAFEAAGGPDGWGAVLSELASDHPGHGVDRGDADRRDLPGDEELDRLRRFEEEVVLRRCYEYVGEVLTGAGMPSVAWDDQARVAHALKAAVAEVDGELSERLNVVTERRPVLDDGLEYDRQKIVLRDRLSVELVDSTHTPGLLDAFVTGDSDDRRHVCGVWLSREVARKQFAFPEGAQLPELVVALLAVARKADGRQVVRLGLLPSTTTPRQCQTLLGETPLLVLTSHLTLTDPSVVEVLARVEPVFVLMDLPVAWHVGDWCRQGARVRMGLVPLEGVESGDLLMAAFALDRQPGFRFVCIGGKVGVSVLTEQLRQRHGGHTERGGHVEHGGHVEVDGAFLRDDAAAFNLVLNHVFGAWHVLDQDAVS
ncbi:hypothetical protein ACFXDH_51015 [Streptomyces sp. NPDC059467]|uniref:hypothetical protein n=1 Tax=Streptomyces sp. NPDC059467 TaxID=3346844 RepID=UPI0036949398